jgi:hypothetical protein
MTTPAVAPVPKIYTPENLTFEDVKGWTGLEMRRQMATPLRSHIIQVISSRPLAEVEAVAAAAPAPEPVPDAVVAPIADNDALLAEAQRLIAEAEARKVVTPAEAPKKIVVDYQITDEDGNPLGRPTHLEASTAEEMVSKQKEAHIQATRAFHRLKKQKVSFKPADAVIPATDDVSDAEILAAIRDMKSDDPKTALAAVKKINSAEAARIKAEADAEIGKVNELRRQEQVTFKFLKEHRDDYNNCDANNQAIGDYFKEHELAWTTDNLEIAFNALESELAPVVKPVAPAAAVVNPPPVAAPVPTTVAAQPVVQPVVTVPAPTPAVVNPPAADPRPGVNGGLMPGQQSAARPAPKTTGLTYEEVRSWDGATMRQKMKNPNLRAQILKFVADHNAKKLLQTA